MYPQATLYFIICIFQEYEKQETPEARFVKELDHLDLLLQAREYEEKGYDDLEEFFRLQFSHPTTTQIAHQILADHKKHKSSATAQVPADTQANGIQNGVNGSKETV